ncbi:hypothetical protein CLOM_g9936 [Closterium sp. NIES-68]|nr:hypothetical protein CLOM_g9936 [Closterium sp. NIES-68]GJP68466.1 hypothetical protein CLOP_g25172 [Closterium sp. NIES-67]
MAAIALGRRILLGAFSRSCAAGPAAATLALHTSALAADASILRHDTSPPSPSTSSSSPPPCPTQTFPHASYRTCPQTSFQAAATGSGSPSPSSLLHHQHQPLLQFSSRGDGITWALGRASMHGMAGRHAAAADRGSTTAGNLISARGYSSVEIHGTTVLCVRKGNEVVIAADGQVTMGAQILKPNVRKVRRLGEKKAVIAGFAGTTADAFTLFDRFESRIDEYPGMCQPRAGMLSDTTYMCILSHNQKLRRMKAKYEVVGAADSPGKGKLFNTGECPVSQGRFSRILF